MSSERESLGVSGVGGPSVGRPALGALLTRRDHARAKLRRGLLFTREASPLATWQWAANATPGSGGQAPRPVKRPARITWGREWERQTGGGTRRWIRTGSPSRTRGGARNGSFHEDFMAGLTPDGEETRT